MPTVPSTAPRAATAPMHRRRRRRCSQSQPQPRAAESPHRRTTNRVGPVETPWAGASAKRPPDPPRSVPAPTACAPGQPRRPRGSRTARAGPPRWRRRRNCPCHARASHSTTRRSSLNLSRRTAGSRRSQERRWRSATESRTARTTRPTPRPQRRSEPCRCASPMPAPGPRRAPRLGRSVP